MWYRSEGQSVNGSLIKTSTKMAQSDTQSPEGPKVGPDPAPPPRAPWGPQDSGSVHLQHPPEQDLAISTALGAVHTRQSSPPYQFLLIAFLFSQRVINLITKYLKQSPCSKRLKHLPCNNHLNMSSPHPAQQHCATWVKYGS